MLRVKIALLVALCCFQMRAIAVILVSPQHPYYPLVEKYILNGDQKDAETEEISEDDKLEECIRKVFIIRRKLSSHSLSKEDYRDYMKVYSVYARIVHDAYVRYPQDALLNTLYAEIVFNSPGKRYKYAKDTESDYGSLGNRYSDIIHNLLPFIKEDNKVPRINYTLWSFFGFLKANLPVTRFYSKEIKDEDGKITIVATGPEDKDAVMNVDDRTEIYRLMGITSNEDEEGILNLLETYWASKVDISYIDTEWRRKRIEEARDFIATGDNEAKAERQWKTFVEAVENSQSQRGRNPKPFAAERKTGLELLLAGFEAKRRITLDELEFCFGQMLRPYADELKDSPDLPNLDRIRERNSEGEAVVLNLWYKFAVHDSRQEVYDGVGAMDGWEGDSRLVFLRLVCARDLKHDKGELKGLADMLVKLEPKSERFRHLQLSLDLAPADATGRTPDAPPPELLELANRKYANAEEALAELESGRDWNLQTVELYFNKLADFRKQLKDSADLPNLDKVEAGGSAGEAAMLNLWYKCAISRKYQEAYEAVGQLPDWEKDARLVFLRLLCGRKLSVEKEEMLRLCDILIGLDPDNPRYRHARLSFEMK